MRLSDWSTQDWFRATSDQLEYEKKLGGLGESYPSEVLPRLEKWTARRFDHQLWDFRSLRKLAVTSRRPRRSERVERCPGLVGVPFRFEGFQGGHSPRAVNERVVGAARRVSVSPPPPFYRYFDVYIFGFSQRRVGYQVG